MEKEILFKTKPETLSLIKEEAERNLAGIQQAEDIITNKSNNLMQILISILLITSGYVATSFFKDRLDELFFISFTFCILLGIVIWKLYKNILPVKSAIVGCEPSQLVQSDMIYGKDKSDKRNILVNRVYNLQNDIELSLKSHSIRYKRFKESNRILLIGLSIIFSTLIILFLIRFYVLFLGVC